MLHAEGILFFYELSVYRDVAKEDGSTLWTLRVCIGSMLPCREISWRHVSIAEAFLGGRDNRLIHLNLSHICYV